MRIAARLFAVLSFLLFLLSAMIFAGAVNGLSARESRERAETSAAQSADHSYILRQENGRVMLYSSADMDAPRETGISYLDLPAEDRAMLDSGIEIEDEQKLLEMLEDYTN